MQKPWGSYEVLLSSNEAKIKRIIVAPNQQLSYQYHNYRSEHWTILEGIAAVMIDDKSYILKKGNSIFIPQGAKHRVANRFNNELIFMEVQIGSYFGEDDIVRIADDYGRV
jgi:mannose-6-phosphate isomerase